MKLGKTKDVETFVDQLKSEGERKFISLFILHLNSSAVFLNGRRLSFTLEYKYLCTLMTHDGSDDANMSRQRGICYACNNGLFKNFYTCSPAVKAVIQNIL